MPGEAGAADQLAAVPHEPPTVEIHVTFPANTPLAIKQTNKSTPKILNFIFISPYKTSSLLQFTKRTFFVTVIGIVFTGQRAQYQIPLYPSFLL
jgi:hypothetical protein